MRQASWYEMKEITIATYQGKPPLNEILNIKTWELFTARPGRGRRGLSHLFISRSAGTEDPPFPSALQNHGKALYPSKNAVNTERERRRDRGEAGGRRHIKKKPTGSSASCVKSRLFPNETGTPLSSWGHLPLVTATSSRQLGWTLHIHDTKKKTQLK